MTLQWLFGWWNLIYVVPFAIALTYLGVYVTTGISFGDADADLDADVDHDVDGDIGADADHDFDADHDVDADADADHDAGHDSDADEQSGKLGAASLAVLHLIGLGKVPLSLIVMILLFTWGISGFAATQYLRFRVMPEQLALYTIPFALAVAIGVTAIVTRFFARIFPMNEAPAMSLAHLVGATGIAVLPINDTFGLAQVQNAQGAAIQVPCRVAPGESPIDASMQIIVLRFDRANRVFYVSTPGRYEALRTHPRDVSASV